MSTVVSLSFVALLMALSVWSICIGRTLSSKQHQRAFAWGLIALCAMPAWVVAAGFMMLSALAGADGGALLVLLALSMLVPGAVVAAVVSAARARKAGPLPNNSSKPTPLRGAA